MSFEHPQGLWLLALALPIVVFHFYKGRVRRLPVPTLLFWEQVILEEERKTALRKLRHVASLLLNLAALFILTSAVSAPELPGLTRSRGRYAILLDNTPSMGALGADARTRLDVAVDRARDFIRSLGYGDQVSIHDLSGSRIPFTSDLERAVRRLTVPPPVDRADLRERVEAALSAGQDVTAVLFSDAPAGGVDDLLASGRLRIARVGEPVDNSGWIAGGLARRSGEKRATLSLTLAGFAAEKVVRSEVLLFNGKELARREAALDPGARLDRVWALDPSAYPGEKLEAGGLIEVALEPRDRFPADDVASFLLPPLVPPQVVVFHGGKPGDFLMSALESLAAGGMIQREVLSAPVASYVKIRPRMGEGWIAVFDRVAPPAPLGEGGALILGGSPGPEVERPTIADWDREAPPNRMNTYAGLVLRRSRILQGTPLIRAVEGPVAVWSSGGGRAVVETGFAFEDAEPRPALPILLFNIVDWAAYRGLRSFRTEFRVGEPIRPERPLWIEEGELQVAQSGRTERTAVRGARPEPPPVAGPGFVRLGSEMRSEWAAINLFDAAESDLRAKAEAPAGAPLPAPARWYARIPYATLAAAAVILLMLFEWWLFHRGVI